MKPLQLVQRGGLRRDLEPVFAAEQTEGFQTFARHRQTLGLERAIRRITQPFHFRRVKEGEDTVVHRQPPPGDALWGLETIMDLAWRHSVLECGRLLPLS